MGRILIGFASHHGQTRKIATRLAEHLRASGHDVELSDLAHRDHAPPPEDYDVVVLASRVELGKHARCVRDYALEHRDALRAMPVAVFSVSNSAASASKADPDPQGYLAAFCKELRLEPAARAVFGGALRYRSYGLITRFVMKRLSKRTGRPTDTTRDHEMTDWGAVREHALEIAALCPGERVAVTRV